MTTSYRTTDEQLVERQRLVERICEIHGEVHRALSALRKLPPLAGDLYRDEHTGEFGDCENRMRDALDAGTAGVSRAFDELVGGLVAWEPDHGHALKATGPADNVMPQ